MLSRQAAPCIGETRDDQEKTIRSFTLPLQPVSIACDSDQFVWSGATAGVLDDE